MADDTGLTQTVRSPRQASTIYGLSGTHAPRPRNLFAVTFSKAGDSTNGSSATSTWSKDLAFMAKSVDRPSVEPKVEEVKQYNKTRLITTGVKYGNCRMTLYDTADSVVMRMWAEYAKYYFGDFRHGSAITDWNSDVVQNTFNDAGGGFGFAPQAATNSTNEFNTQFFFDAISVYQVYGGKFVQYKMVKPKITSFNPDELDYSISEMATFTMTIAFEALIYVNDFQPQPISSDAFLQEAFGASGSLNGNVLEYPGDSTTDPSVTNSTLTSAISPTLGTAVNSYMTTATAPGLQSYDTGRSSGGLSAYGQYNFGSTTSAALSTAPTQSLASDLSFAALSNPVLATALALTANVRQPVSGINFLGGPVIGQRAISQEMLDQSAAAISAAGLGSGSISGGALAEALTYGAIASAYAAGSTPREMIYNRQYPMEQPQYALTGTGNVKQAPIYGAPAPVASPITVETAPGSIVVGEAAPSAPVNNWNATSGQGLSMAPIAYGVANAQRPSTAQIGFNERSKASYQNRFGLPGMTFPKYVPK